MSNLVDFYQSFGGNIDDVLVEGDAKPQEVEFDLPTRQGQPTTPQQTSQTPPQATQSTVTPQVVQSPSVLRIPQTKSAQTATQSVSQPVQTAPTSPVTPPQSPIQQPVQNTSTPATQPIQVTQTKPSVTRQLVGIPTEQIIAEQRQRFAEQQAKQQVANPPQQKVETTSKPQDITESAPQPQHIDKTPQELMEMTDTQYPDIWLKKYEQALKSKKRNHIRDKMVRGRFRIDEHQAVEILPEINTSKMSFGDMLEIKWIPDNSIKSI